MEKNYSFTASKIFGNQSTVSQTEGDFARRRPSSLRQSRRRPIFDRNMYYSSLHDSHLKRPLSYNDEKLQFAELIRDDFCGCEHNLDPCGHIENLVKGLNQRDMREEYQKLDLGEGRVSRQQIKRKYLRYLPPHYPELYHAQLANVISNLGRDLSYQQFMALASIEYHAKLQHLSYFLFSDLRNSLSNKRKFLKDLQVGLIRHEVNYFHLIQQARTSGLPLQELISDFYDSAGAIMVPLSQYAVFLKLLLQQGSTIKLRLLIYLIVLRRDSLAQLTQYYARSILVMRQKSRQLPWETFLQEIKDFL